MSSNSVVCFGAAIAAIALLWHARRRKRYLEGVIDVTDPDYTQRAAAQLQRQGYARLRSPTVFLLTKRLFADAEQFFGDASIKRRAHVPPMERASHDSRTGYIVERNREYLELHPRAKQQTSCVAMMCTATDFSAACHEVCLAVLHALARSNAPLAALLDAEERAATSPATELTAAPASSAVASAVAPMQTFSASMLRVHRYTEDANHPPHCDLGLLTLAPRASAPGLVIQDTHTLEWLRVEELMAEDEALLFGGSTLSEIGGPTPLPHKVARQGQLRFSAPYFCRATPHVALPTSKGRKASSAAAARVSEADGTMTAGDDAQAGAPTPADGSVADFIARINEERREHFFKQREAGGVLQAQATPAWAVPEAPPSSSSGMPLAVATPVAVASTMSPSMPVAVAVPVAAAPSSSGPTAPPPPPKPPARTRHLFYKLDADADGRITRDELIEGFAGEFGASMRSTVGTLFDAHAIGDLVFAEPYVDKVLFNVFYAEVLFDTHDADADGLLTQSQAQAALQFLTRRPTDGGDKPPVLFAFPPDVAPDPTTGELRLGKLWFGALYKGMA